MRRFPLRWLPMAALVLAACAESGPVSPVDDAIDEGAPLVSVMPSLAADAGAAGTDRYVPTLERILRRSVSVVKEKRGEEASAKVVEHVRALYADVKAAKDAEDPAALKQAVRKLEAFSAQLGLRVFGEGLARHVYREAAGKVEALAQEVRAAHEAGEDVTKYARGVRAAHKGLQEARTAAENGRPVVALVHAAHALDLVIKVGAAFGAR